MALLSIALFISPAGCSRAPDGPQRNPLKGRVTYQGKPVQGGRIVFAPDDSKGNSGPGAIAFIREGEFETPPGHGVVSGPHVVDILGYDQEVDTSTDDEPSATVQLSLEVDIPEEGGTYDFDL
jgi:hypothetical protein